MSYLLSTKLGTIKMIDMLIKGIAFGVPLHDFCSRVVPILPPLCTCNFAPSMAKSQSVSDVFRSLVLGCEGTLTALLGRFCMVVDLGLFRNSDLVGLRSPP